MAQAKDTVKKKFKMSNVQRLMLGFAVIILTGALLLCLPAASRDGRSTPFINSLFTATSATCVTGLITYDTYVHWTRFGQIVILLLIQTGGLGFMSFAAAAAMIAGKKIGLAQREMMQESVNGEQVGGIVKLFVMVLKGTFLCEGIGAALLSVRFIPEYGVGEGIFFSVFHSVSAFCNAGFDLMGSRMEGSSLMLFRSDVYFNIVIMLLIVTGGLGFYVWKDVIENRHHIHKYRLHSKLVLTTTAILIFVPAVLFFVFEREHAFADCTPGESVLAAFFQSVTLRTAGFCTSDQSLLSDPSALLSSVMMLTGGSPGSTAGGIKTTTVAVLVLSVVSMIANQKSITVFNRRLDEDLTRRVLAIIFIYLFFALGSVMLICAIDGTPLRETTFEVFSAAGTAGLTMGLTPTLSAAARCILIFLMYFGRIGGLSMAMFFAKPYEATSVSAPLEKIQVG